MRALYEFSRYREQADTSLLQQWALTVVERVLTPAEIKLYCGE